MALFTNNLCYVIAESKPQNHIEYGDIFISTEELWDNSEMDPDQWKIKVNIGKCAQYIEEGRTLQR